MDGKGGSGLERKGRERTGGRGTMTKKQHRTQARNDYDLACRLVVDREIKEEAAIDATNRARDYRDLCLKKLGELQPVRRKK